MNTRRRQLLIDRKIQGAIILRACLYWVTFAVAVVLLTACWLTFTQRPHSSAELFQAVFTQTGVVLLGSGMLLPLVFIDCLRITNRFAGPLYRIHTGVRNVLENGEAKPTSLRKADFLKEFSADVNELMALAQRGCQLDKEIPQQGSASDSDSEVVVRGNGAAKSTSNDRRRLEGIYCLPSAKRRGATVVEFALVAPIFFLFVFGAVEYGRMVMVQQVLTNASREGARRAVLEGADTQSVESVVNDYLTSGSVSGATITIDPNPPGNAGFGEGVTVAVSIDFEQISWLPAPLYLGQTQLQSSTTMRRESVQ